MLCLLAVLNGQPFFYPDTATYVRGADMGITKLLGPRFATAWAPQAAEAAAAAAQDQDGGAALPAVPPARRFTSIEDKLVIAGRSVYYGALLYVGYASSDLWLVVIVQALVAAYLLHLLMVRLWAVRSSVFIATVAALTIFTPLSAFAGLLMPDVFAPLIILAVATLAVYWARLGRADRVALAVIMTFGLISHPSHLALAVALLLPACAARMLSRKARRLSVAGLSLAVACVAAGFAAEWLFFKAVTVTIGEPPLRMPHPMARLVDMGPGTAFLKASCPGSGYAACAYVGNFPTPWVDFIFSADPSKGAFTLADAETKRRISGEQFPFLLDVIRFDPLTVARGLSADLLRQLVMFRVDVLGYRNDVLRYGARLPPETFRTLLQSRAADKSNSWDRTLSFATQASVFAALLIALGLAVSQPQRRGPLAAEAGSAWNDFTLFTSLVMVGVVCNALVCASLASPFDRFQARVIWLLPFLALAALAIVRDTATARARPSIGPPATDNSLAART